MRDGCSEMTLRLEEGHAEAPCSSAESPARPRRPTRARRRGARAGRSIPSRGDRPRSPTPPFRLDVQQRTQPDPPGPRSIATTRLPPDARTATRTNQRGRAPDPTLEGVEHHDPSMSRGAATEARCHSRSTTATPPSKDDAPAAAPDARASPHGLAARHVLPRRRPRFRCSNTMRASRPRSCGLSVMKMGSTNQGPSSTFRAAATPPDRRGSRQAAVEREAGACRAGRARWRSLRWKPSTPRAWPPRAARHRRSSRSVLLDATVDQSANDVSSTASRASPTHARTASRSMLPVRR